MTSELVQRTKSPARTKSPGLARSPGQTRSPALARSPTKTPRPASAVSTMSRELQEMHCFLRLNRVETCDDYTSAPPHLDYRPTRFRFLLGNFSKMLYEGACSEPFTFGGHKWELGLALNADYVKVYLSLDKAQMYPAGVQVALQFNLSLVNLLAPLKSLNISAREGAVFSKNGQCWGCQRFFKLVDVMNEPGFVRNDCLSLELECTIVSTMFQDIITLNPMDVNHDENAKLDKLDLLCSRESYHSSKFYMGGAHWQIRLFPNGDDEKARGKVSMFIKNDDKTNRRYMLECQFTLGELKDPFHVESRRLVTEFPPGSGIGRGVDSICETNKLKNFVSGDHIVVGVKILTLFYASEVVYKNPAIETRTHRDAEGVALLDLMDDQNFKWQLSVNRKALCDNTQAYEIALRLDGSMGRLMYVNYRCYGWICQLRWRVVLRAEGCTPVVLGPSIDIVWNEGAELLMTTPLPAEYSDKTIQILMEMRSCVLFEPSIDGCSAPEVETAVSARQATDRERFVLERSWESKYLKYKKDSSNKEELMKIQSEGKQRSVGSEDHLKASMIISNNFVKDLLRDLSDDPVPFCGGRETSRSQPPEHLADVFERKQEGSGGNGAVVSNILDTFQSSSSTNLTMNQLRQSFQGSLDAPLDARLPSTTIDTIEKSVGDHPDFSVDGPEVKIQVNLSEGSQGSLVRPELVRYEDYREIIEQIIDFCQTRLPFRVTRVAKGGSLGHDTATKSRSDIDLVLYSDDLPKTGHTRWLPSIISALASLLKDAQKMLTKAEKSLPKLTLISTTQYSVQFTVGDLDVDLIPCFDWRNDYSSANLYQTIKEERPMDYIWYLSAACEKESDFIRKQPIKIKDMIRMVKHWRNGILWKDQFHRPSSLLLSLLVIGAHEDLVKKGASNLLITPESMLQRLTDIIQRKHELRLEWSTNYSETARAMFPMKTCPVVRNPSNPSDNVAETGLQNWTQFPGEFTRWAHFIGVVKNRGTMAAKQAKLNVIVQRLSSDF